MEKRKITAAANTNVKVFKKVYCKCFKCQGTGQLSNNQICPLCHGSGFDPERRTTKRVR